MKNSKKIDARANARMHGSTVTAAEQAALCASRRERLAPLLDIQQKGTPEYAALQATVYSVYTGSCKGDSDKVFECAVRSAAQPKSALARGHYFREIAPAGRKDSRQRALCYSAEIKAGGGAVTDSDGKRYTCKYIVYAAAPAEWLFTQPLSVFAEARVIPTRDFYAILDGYSGRRGGSAYKKEGDTVKLQFNSYLRAFLDSCFNSYPTLGDFLGV